MYLFKFKEGEGAHTNFKLLGKFELAGIPPAPCVRGVPQVEVTFDIGASDMLNISTSDKTTGNTTASPSLTTRVVSQEGINRMVEEAEKGNDFANFYDTNFSFSLNFQARMLL